MRRFSEDLDFCLSQKRNYKFDNFVKVLEDQLGNFALEVELKKREKNVVQTVDVRFKNLLFDLGLSNHRDEKLFLKIEIDTNPASGAKREISLVNKTFIFAVTHYDLPSLYATKIHACFYRKYTKGRDFYDLVWYLTKRIRPNVELLNNAIKQTNKIEYPINEDNFKDFLKEKISRVDFDKVKRDVERFLEDKSEIELLRKDMILRLI